MLLQAVASGLALGLVYAGIGAGFSLILSTGRLTNLAHGEFVLVGRLHPLRSLPGIRLAVAGGSRADRCSAARSSGPCFLLSSAGCPDARWTAWR